MKDLEPLEASIFPSARIAQSGVGSLDIEAVAFSSYYQPDRIRFCHEIYIRDAREGAGLGKRVFAGSLEELIDLVKKVSIE